MKQPKPEEKLAIAGVVAAAAVGYFTHWSLGFFIALLVFYKLEKAQRRDTPSGDEKKPFIAKIQDLLKPPRCFETKNEIKAASCDIEGKNNYDHEVVGKSRYRISIWASIPSEHGSTERFRLYFVFTLEKEDDNEHDKNAVAVKLNGTVGYLPREMAKKYRIWSSKQGIGKTATCRGVIVGNKNKDYSIWLDLPF